MWLWTEQSVIISLLWKLSPPEKHLVEMHKKLWFQKYSEDLKIEPQRIVSLSKRNAFA